MMSYSSPIQHCDCKEEDNREVMVEDSSCASSRSDMEWLLEQLRPEEREALYLQTVEGYTAQEIARLTGKSRNTILSLIRRGKKKLMDEARQESAGPRKEAAS
ncbi:MAG: sigma-70 region 4 domain-containing protein [Verrucomicrobiota bacterium]